MTTKNGTSTANGHSANGFHPRPAKERSRWQFRGQHVPARVFFLLKEGRITATDLLLMAIIDAQVKPEGDEDGKGCWSSNPYLAESCDVNEKYVARRIPHLRRQGFLLVVKIDGKRYLELEWSRTGEERGALRGEYGDACRREHARATQIIAGKEVEEELPKSNCTNGQLPKSNYGELPKSNPNTRMKIKEGEKNGTATALPTPPLSEPSVNGNGQAHRFNGEMIIPSAKRNRLVSEFEKVKPPPSCLEMVDQLKKTIRSRNKFIRVGTTTREKQADSFRLLIQDLEGDELRVRRVLDSYERNVNRLKRPDIADAKEFRHHFNWIERELEKLGDGEGWIKVTDPINGDRFVLANNGKN